MAAFHTRDTVALSLELSMSTKTKFGLMYFGKRHQTWDSKQRRYKLLTHTDGLFAETFGYDCLRQPNEK